MDGAAPRFACRARQPAGASRNVDRVHGLEDDDPAGDLQVEIDELGLTIVVRVTGEVDASTAREFENRLFSVVEHSRAEIVVVDLLGIASLGVTGMGVLARIHERAQHRQKLLRVVINRTDEVIGAMASVMPRGLGLLDDLGEPLLPSPRAGEPDGERTARPVRHDRLRRAPVHLVESDRLTSS